MEEERRETSEETTEAALQKALAALEQSNREAEAAYVAREQAATLTERWQAEVEGYKVNPLPPSLPLALSLGSCRTGAVAAVRNHRSGDG